MSELSKVHLFLRVIRRRAQVEALLRVGGITAAAALAVLMILALCATRVGPAGFWPTVTGTVLGLVMVCGVVMGAIGPARLLRSERRVAQLVGSRAPKVASDLLSAVELGAAAANTEHGASRSMTEAFFQGVASRVTSLDARAIVPLRKAAWAGLTLALMAAALSAGAVWAPSSVRRGITLLLRTPNRFEGAVASAQPLVGDVRLTYTYPAYTGLPKRQVEGSTGDIVAIKGTSVVIETRILRSARQALLLLGDNGEQGERPARLEGHKLSASFSLQESGSYRIWLAPLIGRPVRELRAHRIIAESDEPPRVDIFGPADRLELPAPRPIEVGYAATDDFGLGAIDLVYRIAEGPEQRIRLREANSARSLRGTTIFEPPAGAAGPGDLISYHIEARDRDDVSGAKTGSSRTLYLVIENPRENLDEQLARERDILDRLLGNLADRLELGEAGAAGPASGASPAPPDPAARLTSWNSVHESEEAHLALLGRVVDDERRAGTASKSLVSALSGVADRLAKILREEAAALTALHAKADQGALASANFGRLLGIGVKNVAELERSVLLLDDLISRQRLEDLAGAARELTDAYKRLQDLVARYAATKDEALRRQIEREIRALRARIDELGQKIAAIKSRNEVPTEWQNMPDMKDVLDKAQKFDALLEKGDSKSLSKALSELGGALGSLRDMLDKNASDFDGERFPEENRALAELMKKVEDLEGDERALAGDSQALANELDEEVARRLRDQLDKMVAEITTKIDRMREKLGTPAPRELGEDAEDDLKRARESTKQLKRLFGDKEWGESQREAERVASSLRRVRRGLEDKTRKNVSSPLENFGKEIGEAGTLAQEIAAELDKLVPGRAERQTSEQRERGKGMSQRQGTLQERTLELAREAGKQGGQVPGLEKAKPQLEGVAGQMRQAASELERGSAKEGTGKARDAADRLAQLRNDMQRGQPMGRSRNSQEPVRIPGADESKAPREWRQELMEAMRAKAPDRFRDDVRRYYEELVK